MTIALEPLLASLGLTSGAGVGGSARLTVLREAAAHIMQRDVRRP
jgi:hypothetical protein